MAVFLLAITSGMISGNKINYLGLGIFFPDPDTPDSTNIPNGDRAALHCTILQHTLWASTLHDLQHYC